MDFTDRPAVLSTTNGTKATATVADARRVFFGAALNRHAVAQEAYRFAQENNADIVLVCSGTNGQFTLEDATVAGMFVEALYAQGDAWTMPHLSDDSLAARRLWQSESNLLRGWMEGNHAQTLADLGFGEDLGFCAATDIMHQVPVLTDEANAANFAAPVVLVR
jgi:2-phosphosulfolactate phosphatase